MKKKILLVVPSLRAGGAERVMSFLAVNLQGTEYETHLLVIGNQNKVSYEVDAISVTFLNEEKVRNSFFKLGKFLRKYKPDVIISSIAHLNQMMALLSVFFKKTKFVGREVIVISKKFDIKRGFNLSTGLHWITAQLLDKIICQSMDMKYDLRDNLGYPENKLVVINNPVTKKFKIKSKKPTSDTKRFITVGRLHKQKGYFRLLKCLSELDFPFHYTIIGDGPERDKVLEFIEDCNLTTKVTHIPFTQKVEEYLSENDLYIQGSFVEGFPNALLESCAVGTPVLAFNAPGGINEIIISGKNGFIAEDEKDFIHKLKQSINYNWDPEVVRDMVVSRYSEEIILAKYQNLIDNLIHGEK